MNWNTIVERWNAFSTGRKVFVGILLVIVTIGLIIVFSFVRALSNNLLGVGIGGSMPVPMMPNGGYGSANSAALSSNYYAKSASDYAYGGGGNTVAYEQPAVPTSKAELYEMTSYTANIESRKVEEDCKTIQSLKADDAIIFISANTGKTSCSFNFKTDKASTQKALNAIKSLDPKQLNESISTIEDTLISYDRQREILENKLKSIDSILSEAIVAYQQVSKLAVETGSVTNLRQAINDKIDIVERLTQNKLAIEQQLAAINYGSSSDKSETNYAQFSVSIYENKFIDKDELVSSWKSETKRLLREINDSLQSITLGLLKVLLIVFTYILYLLIAVVIIKYLKRALVYIWNKE